MAITNNDLVKFGYGVAANASKEAGHISFASDTRQLFVGDGTAAVAFAGNVANAVFADKKLTITYNDGRDAAVLDFSDVASAEGVSSLLGDLRKDVEANKTSISNLGTTVDTSIKALDASYKAADASLSERIAAFESGDNSVATQIANAIDGLDSSANSDNDFFKLEVVEENGKVTGVNFTNKDVASAATLANVKATAEAAAKQSDFNAHATDNYIHITAQERTDWTSAKTAIDTFLKDASLTGDVIDTLTEIQDYIASDASAADKLVKDLSDVSTRAEKGISDAAAAQGDVDALEGTVSTLSSNFDNHKNNGDIHVTTDDKAKWNAAEQNAKNYADDLASNYDASGAAAGALTNAKEYADAITVNGQAQSDQEISLTGVNIKVGGTGSHKEDSIDAAIEELYTEVGKAQAAGVQSLAVNADSSNYAEVDKSAGAVTLKIKKVALADASDSNTGVADANDVKKSIATAKSEAISAVQGEEGDASTAATVAGAKAYADAQIEANALRWTVLS